jgi:hypothetical protein
MLDFMITEGMQFPVAKHQRTFRKEETYVYHEDDIEGYTNLQVRNLKQNLDMFYDCLQMFSVVTRFHLLPDYQSRKIMTFMYSGVSVVLCGIMKKSVLNMPDKVQEVLHNFVASDRSRSYQTSSFLRRVVHVDTSCFVPDRPAYVCASSNATDINNALKYFQKKVRKGTESQAEIQGPLCVPVSSPTDGVVQNDAI